MLDAVKAWLAARAAERSTRWGAAALVAALVLALLLVAVRLPHLYPTLGDALKYLLGLMGGGGIIGIIWPERR